MTRVAIIGAGPCGMSLLQAFRTAEKNGDDIPEVVCYEKQSDLGGLWNYTWRTGTDQYGEPVHGSMYRYLWSNGPKECLEFADYTFEEHFGKPIPSFPPREVLTDYIKGRVEASGARKFCQFKRAAHWVRYWDESENFTVATRDLESNTRSAETFDYVVVATGHFSVPNVPHFDGFDTTSARVLHAHDFRDAREFEGMDLLIIGTSYSAEDIGSQCYKYGAKSVTISHRTAPTGFHWPEAFAEVPLLTRIDGKTAHFKDGSSKDVDAIILCTGYLHHFPFMAEELKLHTTNRMWSPGLYQGVVLENNPRVMYLGMQDQYYTFNMFDVQAWYVRDVIMGRIQLPSKEEIEADSAKWLEREAGLENYEHEIWFQGDYVQALLDQSDYPKFDVEGINNAFMDWEHHKHDDIMGYRDHGHQSLMTGNEQPVHHTKWIEAMDDSMESYLSDKAA